MDAVKSASLSEIMRQHLYIIIFYMTLSIGVAYYSGRIVGWLNLTAVTKGVGEWGPFIIKPKLRGLSFLFSIMRQQHIPVDSRKKYVFLCVMMKDGSIYEGYLRKYTFLDDKGFNVYLRSATRTKGNHSVQLWDEDPPTDGVIVSSDSISAIEVKYRD